MAPNDDPDALGRVPAGGVPADFRLRIVLAGSSMGYAWLVITGHDVAQDPALRLEALVGIEAWNRMIALAALLAAAVGAWFWLRRVRTVPARPMARLWAGAAFMLAILCHELLMIKSIEMVHFVQYGLLTWMLVPVVRRAPEAAVLSFLVGVADEAYQYFWLHRAWQGYFDLNDVVVNLVGCILAASVWTAASRRPREAARWYRLPAGPFAAALVAMLAAGYATGVVGNHPDTGLYPIQRWNRPQTPTPYVAWSQESGRRYHRLPVWEAWIVLALVGGTFVVVRCDA